MRNTQFLFATLAFSTFISGAALFPFSASADVSIQEYTQCANYLGSGYTTDPTGCRWINGNLVENNSLFYEGEATVQRLLIGGLTPGIHTIMMNYGTTKSGKHAYDFLTDDTFSEKWITTDDFCKGLTAMPSCASLPANFSPLIPVDPNANGLDAATPARHFKIRNGTFVSVTAPTVISGSYSADSETRVALTIDVPSSCSDMVSGGCPVLITWGMHVSKQSDWGMGNSASAISGSPYHISIVFIDGNRVGSRDNQMSANAVKAMVVLTEPAIALTDIDTILNGFANPNGTPAIGWFRYSLTDPGTCDDTFGTRVPESGGTDLGSGTNDVAYSEIVYGLTGGATYYFCAIGQNGAGVVFGNIVSFVTPSYPDLVIFQNPSLYSGKLVVGGAVSFMGVIGNIGSAGVASPFSTHFHVDVNNDGNATNDVVLAPDFTVPSLDSGMGRQVVSGLWTGLPIGTHRVILCADQPPLPNGVIVEPYEDNNCNEAGTGVVTVTPPPVLTITPLFRDFGSIVVGNSVDKSFLLTNTGGGTITGGTFALPAGPFSCAAANGLSRCTFTLRGGESVVKWITYSPISLVESNKLVNVTSNVPTQEVKLYGAGLPAVIGTGLEFGKVIVGEWKDLTLTITNRGGSPVLGVLRVPEPFSCIIGNVPATCAYDIPALRRTNTFTIRLTPPSVGRFLDNADLLAPPFTTFPLSGVGYTPFIRFKEI
jgi:hypothetical protein